MDHTSDFDELRETAYYLSFMKGYERYMQSENLTFSEHPQMMDSLSRIYRDAKRQGMVCANEEISAEEAAKTGMDDGWIAAQSAHLQHETAYRYQALVSRETSDDIEQPEDFSEWEDDFPSESEPDFAAEEPLDEANLPETDTPDDIKVTRDYIRGFLIGYADFLYERGISIDGNEDLKSHLRASFVRALDPADDMFNPIREDGKDAFYPGLLDGRRCAALDLERIAQQLNLNTIPPPQNDKQTDILYRSC